MSRRLQRKHWSSIALERPPVGVREPAPLNQRPLYFGDRRPYRPDFRGVRDHGEHQVRRVLLLVVNGVFDRPRKNHHIQLPMDRAVLDVLARDLQLQPVARPEGVADRRELDLELVNLTRFDQFLAIDGHQVSALPLPAKRSRQPASAQENEQMAVRLEETAFPHRRLIVRQIAGAIARRIVCWVAPGEELDRGEQFGMIKLGSRTELVLPWEPGLQVRVAVGDHVRAGSSVLAQYGSDADGRAP